MNSGRFFRGRGASGCTGVALFSTSLLGLPAQFELVTFAQAGELKSRAGALQCNCSSRNTMQHFSYSFNGHDVRVKPLQSLMGTGCMLLFPNQVFFLFSLMKRYEMFADITCFVSVMAHQAQTINEM